MMTFSEWMNKGPRRTDLPVATSKSTTASNLLTAWDGSLDAAQKGKRDGIGAVEKELSLLIERYRSDVVDREKQKLPWAVRVVLDEDFNKLLHKSRKEQTGLAGFKGLLDDFSTRWTAHIDTGFEIVGIKPSNLVLTVHSGMAEVGHIGLIGGSAPTMRFIADRGAAFPDPQPHFPGRTGKMLVHSVSQADFLKGLPGTAWTGLVQIAQRTNAPNDMIFLVANNPMVNHFTSGHHNSYTSLEVPPVSHGKNTCHNEALDRLLQYNIISIADNDWYGCPPGIAKTADAGCLFGFSMVKSDSELGHYWNFTSFSMNENATGIFEETLDQERATPRQKIDFARTKTVPAGAPVIRRCAKRVDATVPKDWAIAIWEATRELGFSRGVV